MDGFKVIYRDLNGILQETCFGRPFSSCFDSMDSESAIRLVFSLAHPGCQIVSISSCVLDFSE